MLDADVVCYGDAHGPLVRYACAGLALWTVAPLALLCLRIRAFQQHRQSTAVQRTHGYFYAGLRPEYWWWDLVVKRADVCTFMLISYTNLVLDARAKLLWYQPPQPTLF